MHFLRRWTHVLVTICLFWTLASTAQERYIDSIFTEINVRSFVFSDTLELDFYSAKNNELTDRPIMILVHGGGFAIGKKDNLLEKKFCTAMAAKGYAVASISYRLTRKGKSFDCDCPTEEKLATFKTASEDVLKAVGHLAKNTGSLGFDRNKIILVGSSAGAEAVLNTVFMRYHRDFRQLPYGNLQFAGVISFSGAVLNADYITEQTAIPTLLFHGVKDKLVPYGTAAHHYCDEDTPGYLPLDGSNTIAQRLSKLGAPYTLYVDMEGNHDWANKAYAHTHDISNFIKTVILDGVWQQSKIRLTP